ncbi:MAG: beta-propeller fold lactonase family protein [Bacteroidetes bacterium]|nr:beta-propeller fold lactonase family protein [Bacteroidota bacterium]
MELNYTKRAVCLLFLVFSAIISNALPPTITSFSPGNGCTGTVVTITGTDFTGATAVSFGGVNATSFTVNSATSITAVVGNGATGVVKVTTASGTATSVSKYTYAFGFTPYAYIANYGSDNISVINTASNSVISIVPVGVDPFGVAASPDGTKVYVVNSGSNNVSVINTATNAVAATVAVGSAPYGVTVSPDGSKVYVTNHTSNTISVINAVTNTVTASVTVGTGPYCAVVSPDGLKLYVVNFGSNNVSVINTATNTVTATVAVGSSPMSICVSPDGARVYVTNDYSNSVSVISTATNTVVATVAVGSYPKGIASSPDGSKVYVGNSNSNTVSVINTATNTVSATIPAGGDPIGLSVTPDGSKVYVTNCFSPNNTVSVINTATNTISATVTVGTLPYSLGNFIANVPVACPPPPTITSFTPTTAPKGATVTITGTNFNGAFNVSFGGIAASSFTLVNSNTITATVGNGASGNVSVSTPGGTAIKAGFTFIPPPAIRSFTPASGCRGTIVTITGINFTGTTAVSFGGVSAASFTVLSNTSITAEVGSGATGVIKVTTPGGSATSATNYIYAASGTTPQAYVANSNDNTVSVINTATNLVTATVAVGTNPVGVSISPDGKKVYVVNSGSNNVSVINTSTNTVLTSVAVGQYPRGVCVSPDGSKVYVSNNLSQSVSVINTSTNTVTATIMVGNYPSGICVSPDGTKVYVANFFSDNVSVINTATNLVTATIGVGQYPFGVCVSPDGSKVFVAISGYGTVNVINTSTNLVTASIPLGTGSGPNGISVSPNGANVYVSKTLNNTVSVIQVASNTVIADIPVGNSPYGVKVTPDGSKVYVANSGSNDVSVINTSTNMVIATVPVGTVPNSLGDFIANVPNTCPPAPSVISYSPTAAAPGATVTITGNYFTDAISVSFGGVSAASFTVVNSSTIKAVVGNGASGSVSVTTLDGKGSLAGFIYCDPSKTVTAVTSISQQLVSNNCGARVYRYTAWGAVNGTGFAWTLPSTLGGGASGASIDSGDLASSKVIRVRYASNNAAINGDSIRVRAYNLCFTAETRAFSLTNAAWVQLALPAITTTNVVTNVCGGRKVRYSIPAPATGSGLVIPEWSFVGSVLGTNAVIDSGNANSRTIVVLFSSNLAAAANDSVRVRFNYNSGCTFSAIVSTKINLLSFNPPSSAVTSISQQLVSNTCGARVYRYTAWGAVNGTGFAWTLPATLGGIPSGATIDSGDLASSKVIRVRYTSNAAALTTDSIRVRAYNLCSSAEMRGFRLTNTALQGCIPPQIPARRANSELITFGAKVYPNPSLGAFNVQLMGNGSEEVELRVLDVQGRAIRQLRTAPKGIITLGSELKSGVYLLEVRQGANRQTTRILKQ